MISRRTVGISLLVWALGMGLVILADKELELPRAFTIAHVVGAGCVGSLIDYIIFCRRPKKEVNVCESCFTSIKGLRLVREEHIQTKEGA